MGLLLLTVPINWRVCLPPCSVRLPFDRRKLGASRGSIAFNLFVTYGATQPSRCKNKISRPLFVY